MKFIKNMRFLLFALWHSMLIFSFIQCDSSKDIPENLDFKVLFDSQESSEIACYRIPVLATTVNGDLIAAADQRVPSCGDLRSNSNINIVIRRSEDNGDSWSEMKVIVDYPLGESASDPSMIVDRMTEEVFMFYNYMDLINSKGEYRLKVISSKNEGKSWSSPTDITSQITKGDWDNDFKFITSGKGVQTQSGQLLHTLVNLDKGLHVFSSKDHGQSWFLIDTPIFPGDESKIVELDNGQWMINSRVNKAGLRYVHTSIDKGNTWISRPDSSLIDPSCNASLLNYSPTQNKIDGSVLLFSNAKTIDSRSNLTIQVSYDQGNTWAHSKTIYPGKAAYSSLTSTGNDEIALFFEKDNYRTIDFISIPIQWLRDNN